MFTEYLLPLLTNGVLLKEVKKIISVISTPTFDEIIYFFKGGIVQET